MMMWLSIALAAQVGVATAPVRVCIDPRTGYANVDFMFTNPTDKVRAITEMRGMVFDAACTVI